MTKKWLAVAAACMCISVCVPITAAAAEGVWKQTESGGWRYQRADGSMAKNTWEDIDGEWYFFGDDELMLTGWQKIGNMRYDLTDSGALAEGWRYCEEANGQMYFSKNGNAKIGWLFDKGNWYWFNANGLLNTSATKEIDGQKYYFDEDGRMQANQYRGFKYIDSDGIMKSEYDVTAVDNKGKKQSVESDEKDEIGNEINKLPGGWLKFFVENDWKFVYCPEKEYYSYVKDDETNEQRYIRYKVSTSEKKLYFTEADAIASGFGEYIYYAGNVNSNDSGFSDEVTWSIEQIREITELPESSDTDYRLIFGMLFADYLDEEDNYGIRDNLEDVCKIIEEIINSKEPVYD